MATGAESKGGTDKTTKRREEESNGDDDAGFCDANSVDDELALLMPSLTRRFQALEDGNDETLNCMRLPNMADENSAHNDKENAGAKRRTLQQFKRRRGSNRITTSRPIDFGKLLTNYNTLVSPPSGSLYKNITAVLKENTNNTGVHSEIVDDFWYTEMQRKMSAVARRTLTGNKTPVQNKPQPVEDRHVRHARSYRGGTSRKVGRRQRPITLDLDYNALKISEWDQEKLAVEEVPSPRTSSRPFISAVKTFLEEGSHPNYPSEAPRKAHSRCSLSDMDLSLGESPIIVEQDVSSRVEHCQDQCVQDTGDQNPHPISRKSVCQGDTFPDKGIELNSVHLEAMEQSSSQSPGLSRCSQENDGGHPREIVNHSPRLMEWNLEEDSLLTPCKVSPVHDRSIQILDSPATSPTPPSNPLAVYMSLRHLEGDVGQRKLAFLSSSSSDTDESCKAQRFNGAEVQSLRDLCQGRETHMSAAEDDLQVEEAKMDGVDSRVEEAKMDGVDLPVEEAKMDGVDLPVEVAKLDGGDPPVRHHYPPKEYDNSNSGQYLLFNSKAESPVQGGDALLAISQNYPDDDIDLKVQAVNEVGLFHEQPMGSGQTEQPLARRSAHLEGSHQEFDDDAGNIGEQQAGDIEPAVRSPQQNIASDEGLIWKDEGSTTQAKPKRLRKLNNAEERRSSLEEGGSLWKNGQRCSQRIRVRPLEWWRGEKLLYGRVHNSLATIIGIKHSSPGQYARGINAPFTVESYVPDQYSELVRLAAI